MSDHERHEAGTPPESADDAALVTEVARLSAALDTALRAAAAAEVEQGRLEGELAKTTELWLAACHHHEQWDILFSENVEDLRLANERAEIAGRRREEIEQSTSWRLLQAALVPYRRIRGRR